MGDRANVKIGNVYLYTHWGGSDLVDKVRQALAKKWRWDDEPYLTRIIFCTMVGRDEFDEETGFGISTEICDGEDRIIEIDVDNQTVQIGNRKKMSFGEFVKSSIGWSN